MRTHTLGTPLPEKVIGPDGVVEKVIGAKLTLEGDYARKRMKADGVKSAIAARESNAEGKAPYKTWAVLNIESSAMMDSRLTPAQKFLLVAYVGVMGIGNIVEASQRDMAAKFSCSLMTVSSATKKLVEYGYLVRGPDGKLSVSKDIAYRGSWNKF